MSWLDRIFGTGQRGQEPPPTPEQEHVGTGFTSVQAEKITEQGARV